LNASNFERLFKIPVDNYFLYNLESPSDKVLNEEDIKKIQTICGFSINGMRSSSGQYNMFVNGTVSGGHLFKITPDLERIKYITKVRIII
jgi:hypothetical protein